MQDLILMMIKCTYVVDALLSEAAHLAHDVIDQVLLVHVLGELAELVEREGLVLDLACVLLERKHCLLTAKFVVERHFYY